MLELERAAHEAEVYDNYIERLVSIHAECSGKVDWKSILDQPEPKEPRRLTVNEDKARKTLRMYRPGFVDKLFKRVEKVRQNLEDNIDRAKTVDEEIYRAAYEKFQNEHGDWLDSCKFSERILNRDLEAYVEAIEEINPFAEIGVLGGGVSFSISRPEVVSASVRVRGEDVVPSESKGLLASGKLTTKKLPKGRFYEIYQDYVCSCVLRVAGELFALLPIDATIVTAKDDLLNTRTGHIEEQAILSVAIPRATFEVLNLTAIDPSDSMQNFVNRMNFRKAKGFDAVKPIELSDVDLIQQEPKRRGE